MKQQRQLEPVEMLSGHCYSGSAAQSQLGLLEVFEDVSSPTQKIAQN